MVYALCIHKSRAFAAILAAGVEAGVYPKDEWLVGGWDNPLHKAAEKGLAKECKLLLDIGIGVDCISCDGATPLCYAVALENFNACKVLISAGADVNFRIGRQSSSFSIFQEGSTPLSIATKWG